MPEGAEVLLEVELTELVPLLGEERLDVECAHVLAGTQLHQVGKLGEVRGHGDE